MNMTGVEIINFQSHEKTKIDLRGGINVFVGTSDSGKSAIIRALKWNLTNSPTGVEFIKEGTTEAVVTVFFEDGHAVERRRTKTSSKNSYTLLKDGLVLEEYTGFGSKVPPGILEVTRINPDFDFNFANQLEAPFLLSETPKVRAETIGNLEELGKIDLELTKLNEDVRDKKRQQKSTQTDMKKIEKERADLLADLNVSRVKAETIKQLKEAIIEKTRVFQVLEKSRERIQNLEYEIARVRETIERTERILERWDESAVQRVEGFERLTVILKRLLELKSEASLITYMNEDKLNQLLSLSAHASDIVASYQRALQLKTQLERNADEAIRIKGSFSAKAAAISIGEVDMEVSRFKELFMRTKRLSDIEKTKKQLAQEVTVASREIESLLTQFVDALQKAEMCPTCLQPTTNIEEHQIAHSI